MNMHLDPVGPWSVAATGCKPTGAMSQLVQQNLPEPDMRLKHANLVAEKRMNKKCALGGLTPRALVLRHEASCYCALKPTVSDVLTTGGGFHLPVSASALGLYSRMVRLNPPLGDGSQLASLFLPGLSF